ncbi:O-antigen ligase [Proteiniborus ethanoligenes]|uniref:O-antigen ligase n=1 Tax=Proteiniborus ethanoligenes TaxID=415015 RepID=A0A1H3LEN5_9FIRM|nr:O-antigen ligase family protein [Proteiniborus ethanoligenes]SDY62404.1 O-antigen ligase [Proteiniborus ethanoligenes]
MKLNKIILYLIALILILGAILPVASYFFIGILIVLLILFKQERIIWSYLSHNKILIIMVLSTLLSSLFSELWYISILFSLLYIMKILFCSIVGSYLDDDSIHKILLLIILLGIVISSMGIVQYFYFNGDIPKSWVDSNVYNISFRAYATFFNPNILALFLNLTSLAGLVYFESNKNKKYNLIGVLCFILSLMCLLLTYSRSGWLSLSVSLAGLSIVNKKYIRYAVLFPIVFLTFDILGGVGRLYPQNIAIDSSIGYRKKIWSASIGIIKDNFILGIGPGTTWERLPLYSSTIKAYVSHVHNIYLQKLVDTGIIGLLFFFCFIKYVWERIKTDVYKNKEIGLISFGFYIAILSNGLFDGTSFQSQLSIFLWLLIGISLGEKDITTCINKGLLNE